MVASKMQNWGEFVRWYKAGRTYEWIQAKYLDKYGVSITLGTVSNWAKKARAEFEIDSRLVVDRRLIPWDYLPEHSVAADLNMLRSEARRRGGLEVAPATLRKLEAWLRRLERRNEVVHYDPAKGWSHEPRRPGIDMDIIREPDTPVRRPRRRPNRS